MLRRLRAGINAECFGSCMGLHKRPHTLQEVWIICFCRRPVKARCSLLVCPAGLFGRLKSARFKRWKQLISLRRAAHAQHAARKAYVARTPYLPMKRSRPPKKTRVLYFLHLLWVLSYETPLGNFILLDPCSFRMLLLLILRAILQARHPEIKNTASPE